MNNPVDPIPETMKAVVLTGHGGLDKLDYRDDWTVPKPGQGEVLVRVRACGLNNTDVNTRTGWYSKSVTEATTGSELPTATGQDAGWGGSQLCFPFIQGADVSGEVAAISAGGDSGLLGKRVLIDVWLRDWKDPLNLNKCRYFGTEVNGGFAEYTVVDQRNVHTVESDLSDVELASFATSYVTAENMLNRAGVGPGDNVLITGASGGVGSALIQLVNRREAISIAMASTSKHAEVAKADPHAMLPRSPEDLPQALHDAIGNESVDVVADVVGGNTWPTLIDALSRGGRYTCSGAIAGPIVPLDLRTLYLHDLTFTGATVVAPHTFADLVGYIERGEIQPLVAHSYPLAQLRTAQQKFIDKKHVGNIVVYT